ncbi:inositol monophosphatase family protein [Helicobacter sp. MIT 14-3879]|uniref:inositol monophosphatase family protein n=1 Tax=Helicobacter sp. MIT 14-3879 TaxID=2040649 RepID=UPI0015F183F9|nr:inositol monophosphatase family protein [Helicobacter sp. MIT 14-3879]
MKEFINKALDAGLKIALELNNTNKDLYIKHTLGAGGDISIGADLISEQIFIESLSEFGNIDSEESGFIDNNRQHTIIIDPLDGSDNFLSNIPYYGASIAIPSLDIGIIMNFCNLNAIVHSENKNFCGTLAQDFSEFKELIALNTSKCGIFEGAYSNPNICSLLASSNIKFRSLGALALSLGLVYNVSFVLFCGKKRKYDLEAGYLISKNLYKIENKKLALISKDKNLFDNIAKLLF